MADKKLSISTKKYKGETSPVSARLTLDLIARIDDVAEKTGRTRNEIIQKCIEFAIDNIEITKE